MTDWDGTAQADREGTAPLLIDARAMRCPLPVLRLQRAGAQAPAGTALRLLATDAVALQDVPALCREKQWTVSCQPLDGGVLQFDIIT